MSRIGFDIVNRFLLQKQHLADVSRSDDIIQIVKDIYGLHATSPATPYLSLFSRCRSFAKERLDKELYVKRTLGKIRCVRKTIYIIPSETIPIAFAATRKMVELNSENYAMFLGVTQKQYEEISKRILSILKRGGMSAEEIKKHLKTKTNVSPIVNLMCDQGLLIRGPPKAGWKSNIHIYCLFHDYYPDIDLNAVDESEARKLTVRQYVSSFGPATENDVAWWTVLPRGIVRQILRELQETTTSIEIKDMNDGYFVLSSDKAPLASLRVPKEHTVNLLPSLDPYLMGYKDRERYLDLKYYTFVFDRGGNATSSILLDGRVIGVWDFEEPFVKIFLFNNDGGAEVLREIRSSAKKVGSFISGEEVTIKTCDSMLPLTQRTMGGAMSPLKENID
ncbi:MAG: AlkZ family DNA glycosylase [Thaumarchaeota archaeon]|nr:AlkZ family DNA glycosylase [Nitrososphaerota archaeon]